MSFRAGLVDNTGKVPLEYVTDFNTLPVNTVFIDGLANHDGAYLASTDTPSRVLYNGGLAVSDTGIILVSPAGTPITNFTMSGIGVDKDGRMVLSDAVELIYMGVGRTNEGAVYGTAPPVIPTGPTNLFLNPRWCNTAATPDSWTVVGTIAKNATLSLPEYCVYDFTGPWGALAQRFSWEAGKTYMVGCYIEPSSQINAAYPVISLDSTSNFTKLDDQSKASVAGKRYMLITPISAIQSGINIGLPASGSVNVFTVSRPFLYETTDTTLEWNGGDQPNCS